MPLLLVVCLSDMPVPVLFNDLLQYSTRQVQPVSPAVRLDGLTIVRFLAAPAAAVEQQQVWSLGAPLYDLSIHYK